MHRPIWVLVIVGAAGAAGLVRGLLQRPTPLGLCLTLACLGAEVPQPAFEATSAAHGPSECRARPLRHCTTVCRGFHNDWWPWGTSGVHCHVRCVTGW